MTLLLREGYVTSVTDYTYVISDSQFGLESQSYEQFFGLGGGEGDPVGTSFQLGGPVIVDLPFVGDTEIFRAQINGEIAATFGLNVLAELNLGSPDPENPDEPQPGSITATLPYVLSTAIPDVSNIASGEIIDLHFASNYEHGAGAGFETLFPSLVFKLDLVAELKALLAAEIGVFGNNTEITVLDFDVGTVIPLIDVDTARTDENGDADPLNILGVTTQELVDELPFVEKAYDYNGNFAGVSLPFSQFLGSPQAEEKDKAEVDGEGDTQADEQEEAPDPSGLDLGSLEIFIPNINTVSTFADGIYVTDPSKRLVNGEAVDVENDNNPLNQGNRAELAALTVDLDGLLTYATGFAFPPLEYTFPTLEGSLGPANFFADFSYNLLDVELRAGLPLEQEFTLTPDMEERLFFYEVNEDGTGPALDAEGNKIEKAVEVVQIAKALTFVESGSIQSEALETRLKEIAQESLVAARDIDLFIDFDAGVPAGFTGETASIGGRLVMRAVGETDWSPLFSGDVLVESAPALGENQNVELDTSGFELAYQIFRDDTAADDDEFVAISLEEAAGALVFEDVERVAALTETPFLSELEVLNLRYDGDETFVEVEHRAVPIVTNRTGLEFDLSLLLEGLSASAEFGASIDLGPFSLGTSLGFDVGPLYSERFALFNAELVDLFNDTFRLDESYTTSFVLGDEAAPNDYGTAITGTELADLLEGGDANDVLVGLAGHDTLNGFAGNDTFFGGEGSDTIDGGTGIDTADYGDLGFRVSTATGWIFEPGTRLGANLYIWNDGSGPGTYVGNFSNGDVDVLAGVERLLLTDNSDFLGFGQLTGGPITSDVQVVEARGGDDFITLEQFDGPQALRIDAGEGDDTLEFNEYDLLSGDLSDWSIDGGDGIDSLLITESFDLSNPTSDLGVQIIGFENLSAASFEVTEGLTLAGDEKANEIIGSYNVDTLIGGEGDDTLYSSTWARDGSDVTEFDGDTFIGGAGADFMKGYTGIDRVDYSDADTSVFIQFESASLARGYRGEAQGDVLQNIEEIEGSAFDDILIGGSLFNVLEGGDGNDRIMGMSHNDDLIGGAGDDLLVQGADVYRNSQHNTEYHGGEGFDIVAVQTFDEFRQTGTVTGSAEFTYITGGFYSTSTSTSTRDVEVSYRYQRTGHVNVTLDENGDGLIRYMEDDAGDRVYATHIEGTAAYSYRPTASILDWFPSYKTKTVSYDNNIGDKLLPALDNDSISFTKSGNKNNGSGKVTSPGSVDPSHGQYNSEVFTGIEGFIGSQGNDRLTGNSHDNAFFGNGGADLLQGGGGNDRLGFGEAQSLEDVFSFPGNNGAFGGGANATLYYDLEERLQYLNPEGTQYTDNVGNDWRPVGKIVINSSGATQDVGSFLWGQEGIDTLDMRYDRGISFFPDRSDNYAVVDLNIASGAAPINNYTGETIEYGRAIWYDGNDNQLSYATTFGVENIIGTRNNDILLGDTNNNKIEGGGGADIMDGDLGDDTLSYSRSDEGVALTFDQNTAGVLTLTNASGGDAEGDHAIGFEAYELSANVDTLNFTGEFETLTANRSAYGSDFTFEGARPSYAARTDFELGDGDDVVTVQETSQLWFEMGAGDDQLNLRSASGVVAYLGEGDDLVQIDDRGAPVLIGSATNYIDGGDGFDRVEITGLVSSLSVVNGLAHVQTKRELTSDEVDDASIWSFGGPNASELNYLNDNYVASITHRLTNVEELVINGSVIRLDSVDPVLGDNVVLTFDEDASDPFALDANISNDEMGDQFEVLSLPKGAQLMTAAGIVVTDGMVLTGAEVADLMVAPGQDYGQAPGVFVFERLGEQALLDGGEEPARSVTLPRDPPLPGVALNLETPIDPLGNDLTITVVNVPTEGQIVIMEPDPDYLAVGLTVMRPRALEAGDQLTAEEVSELRFVGGENDNGIAGQFVYDAATQFGFRDLNTIEDFDLNLGELAPLDGVARRYVTINVTPVDDAPDVSRLLFPMSPEGELQAVVSATDAEGDAFTLSVVDAPTLGTLELQPDGSFTYVQSGEIDFGGAEFIDDFFTVRATQDNGLTSELKTQTIRIVAPEALEAIVFDETNAEVFFDEDGAPIALGGLGTNDTIVGHVGKDKLFGFGGNDSLEGGEGDDEIDGGAGNDTMRGGLGDDYYVIDSMRDLTVEKAGEGDDTVEGAFDVRVKPYIETILLNGREGDDLLGLGNNQNNTIHGDHGNNRLDGKIGENLLDAASSPLFEGALLGDDTLVDRDGGDTMIGGEGDDIYRITGSDFGPSVLIEAADEGYDMVISNQSLTIADNIEEVRLFNLVDIDVTGNAQANEVNGNNGKNVISGAAGDDTLRGAGGDDTLIGGDDNDQLRGGNGRDLLQGDDGDDIIRGDSGADTLEGGAGADQVYGGIGNDQLSGGTGADLFCFTGNIGVDVITDFEDSTGPEGAYDGLDRIRLSGYSELNGGEELEFADLLIRQIGTTARVQLDLDGDGAADNLDLDGDGNLDTFRINLLETDVTQLDAFDFLF